MSAVMPETRVDLASRVVAEAKKLGAEEVTVSVSEGSHTTVLRRDGKVEQATEATNRGMSVALMVDGRFSSHGTSDLRPDALKAFLKRAIDATRFLEPDPHRALPDPALCGRGVTDEQLDSLDPTWADHTAEDRASQAVAIEEALEQVDLPNRISAAVYVADGSSQSVRVDSNGFADETRGAWFAAGGEATIRDGDRRPEASAYFGARYLSDLPSADAIAADIEASIHERLGSGPIASGTYPMFLDRRVAGRILGILGGPLSGSSLHHKRSCLAGKQGEKIGSDLFTLIDDPTIPRGLGSRPWDGDAMFAKPRTIIEEGVLRDYYLSVYYGRKLERAPTTGGRSNWVLPVGDKSVTELANNFDKALLVTGFLGGNSNGVTGDFSFGIRGVLLENGEAGQSLSEMNVAGNVLEIFHKLAATANDPWTFSAVRSPTLVFEDVQFSGT